LAGILTEFPDRDFALVTRENNAAMKKIAADLGFQKSDANSPGLLAILDKDGDGEIADRVLFTRQNEKKME